MRAIALGLERLSRVLDELAIRGAILAVVVMIGAASWQVVARYILAQPPIWTEELARYSMVWAGVLGGSCAFRAAADPSLFPSMRLLPGLIGGILTVLRAVGTLAFATPVLWFSLFGLNGNLDAGYVARLMTRKADTMDLPMIMFGIAIPIAFALIVIHVLAELARSWTGEPHTIS